MISEEKLIEYFRTHPEIYYQTLQEEFGKSVVYTLSTLEFKGLLTHSYVKGYLVYTRTPALEKIMTAMKDALVGAGLKPTPVRQRVWQWLHLNQGKTAKEASIALGIDHGDASSCLGDMVKRGMCSTVLQPIPGSNREVNVYTALGGEYRLLPYIKAAPTAKELHSFLLKAGVMTSEALAKHFDCKPVQISRLLAALGDAVEQSAEGYRALVGVSNKDLEVSVMDLLGKAAIPASTHYLATSLHVTQKQVREVCKALLAENKLASHPIDSWNSTFQPQLAKTVLEILGSKPCTLDELLRKAMSTAQDLNAVLLTLVAQGSVHNNNNYHYWLHQSEDTPVQMLLEYVKASIGGLPSLYLAAYLGRSMVETLATLKNTAGLHESHGLWEVDAPSERLENTVLEILGSKPHGFDELLRKAMSTAQDLNAVLLTLVAQGSVHTGDNYYWMHQSEDTPTQMLLEYMKISVSGAPLLHVSAYLGRSIAETLEILKNTEGLRIIDGLWQVDPPHIRLGKTVLQHLQQQPCTFDELLDKTAANSQELNAALHTLCRQGLVALGGDGCYGYQPEKHLQEQVLGLLRAKGYMTLVELVSAVEPGRYSLLNVLERLLRQHRVYTHESRYWLAKHVSVSTADLRDYVKSCETPVSTYSIAAHFGLSFLPVQSALKAGGALGISQRSLGEWVVYDTQTPKEYVLDRLKKHPVQTMGDLLNNASMPANYVSSALQGLLGSEVHGDREVGYWLHKSETTTVKELQDFVRRGDSRTTPEMAQFMGRSESNTRTLLKSLPFHQSETTGRWKLHKAPDKVQGLEQAILCHLRASNGLTWDELVKAAGIESKQLIAPMKALQKNDQIGILDRTWFAKIPTAKIDVLKLPLEEAFELYTNLKKMFG